MTQRPQATNTSLTEVHVRSMRLRHARGQATVRELAAEHRMAAESVRKILRRETWAWVSDEGPGAPPEAWEQPPAAEALAASQARFLEGLAADSREPSPRGERLLGELDGQPNVAGVGLGIPATNGQLTDGGKE